MQKKFIPRTSYFADFYQNSFYGPRISRPFCQVIGVHGIHLAGAIGAMTIEADEVNHHEDSVTMKLTIVWFVKTLVIS